MFVLSINRMCIEIILLDEAVYKCGCLTVCVILYRWLLDADMKLRRRIYLVSNGFKRNSLKVRCVPCSLYSALLVCVWPADCQSGLAAPHLGVPQWCELPHVKGLALLDWERHEVDQLFTQVSHGSVETPPNQLREMWGRQRRAPISNVQELKFRTSLLYIFPFKSGSNA